MGFWSRLVGISSYDPAQVVLPEPYEPFMATGGIPVADPGSELETWVGGERTGPERFWRAQPNLRKVVDFIARNVASVPLQTFERKSDTERVRVTDHPLASLISTPAPRVGAFRFWHAVLSDGLLYDRWCVLRRENDDGTTRLVQVPSWRLHIDVNELREVVGLRYFTGDGDLLDDPMARWVTLPLEDAIFDHGYAPQLAGLSPVTTLRNVLEESAEAVRYRRDVWENGARMPGYITRPADAGDWTDTQRNRFQTAMRSVYGRDGTNAGGMPLLEDGMEIKSTDVFTPQDANDLEGRRLSAMEVAAAFHIAPELVGAQQGNYSNIREFRQMLYRDSLGPYIRALEDAINTMLVPMLAEGRPLYVEANVEAKLRGSFEEQAQIMSTATGAPWITRNEARAMQNRPPLPGGDEIVTPLNVLVGGQAAPTDSGSQNLNTSAAPLTKAATVADDRGLPGRYEQRHLDQLRAFFDRQERVIRSVMGAKADPDWWDADRWDRELANDLMALSAYTAKQVGRDAATRLGFDPDDYDQDRTLAFLRAVAASNAAKINAATRDAIDEALADADAGDPVGDVFATARDRRAAYLAVGLVTAAAAFGRKEAAEQVSGGRATKTWVVTSSNPRESHARLSGVTVGIDDTFPNGLKWPGDGSNADETAGCTCVLQVDIPRPEEGA